MIRQVRSCYSNNRLRLATQKGIPKAKRIQQPFPKLINIEDPSSLGRIGFSALAPSGGISEVSRASARAGERSGRKGENL